MVRYREMLGLPKGEVFLVPWTTEWETEFILEKKRIQDVIGKYIVDVHHIIDIYLSS
jgi:GrpB-like predicted nucleotidyltransferase (UPF0157 family)